MRVYEFARKNKLPSDKIIEFLQDGGFEILSHLQNLDENAISFLEKKFHLKGDIVIKEKKYIDFLVIELNKIGNLVFKDKHKEIEIKEIYFQAFYNKNKYKKFYIEKRSGGVREIYSPNKKLKYILKLLNIVFQELYKTNLSAHGFIPNRSIKTNATRHVGKNYVLNIDLENFFPNIHQARVWKILQCKPFDFSQELANVIAGLVCYQTNNNEKNFLPQGAPTSPILSNFICKRLDKNLLNLCKNRNIIYTRYADDITFSADYNVFNKDGDFIKQVFDIIKKENFKVNHKKTRLQGRGYRQEVTGVIVNDKLNVHRKYIKNLRALIYLVKKFGFEEARKIYKYKNGNKDILDVINGKLNYLKMIKGEEDSTYLKLFEKYNNLYKKDEKQAVDFKHNPKLVVKILKKFTQNSDLKFTTHSWDNGGYESYDEFMEKIKKEWDEVKGTLKTLKEKLYFKIDSFLFNDKLGEKKKNSDSFYTWGEKRAIFGWSSPELKEYCNHSGINFNPFNYKFTKNIFLDYEDGSIKTFKELSMIFKNEIEIRSDENALREIFSSLRENFLDRFNCTLDRNLIGIDFFTDVQHFKNGLIKIFENIKAREKFKNIEIYAKEFEEYKEIYIVHIDSVLDKNSKEFYDKIIKCGGDLGDVYDSFYSLCDWEIIAKAKDGNFKFNILSSNPGIFDYSEEIRGFTHILRFYI